MVFLNKKHNVINPKLKPSHHDTVDGRNPAPVDTENIPSFIRFHRLQVVSRISSSNRIFNMFFFRDFIPIFTCLNHHDTFTFRDLCQMFCASCFSKLGSKLTRDVCFHFLFQQQIPWFLSCFCCERRITRETSFWVCEVTFNLPTCCVTLHRSPR